MVLATVVCGTAAARVVVPDAASDCEESTIVNTSTGAVTCGTIQCPAGSFRTQCAAAETNPLSDPLYKWCSCSDLATSEKPPSWFIGPCFTYRKTTGGVISAHCTSLICEGFPAEGCEPHDAGDLVRCRCGD